VDRINGSFSYIDCESGLTSTYVVHSLIILASYLFGLYTFRISHPEYLMTLIEKVWWYCRLRYLYSEHFKRYFWTLLKDMESFLKKDCYSTWGIMKNFTVIIFMHAYHLEFYVFLLYYGWYFQHLLTCFELRLTVWWTRIHTWSGLLHIMYHI